jgi:hypothetical protein
MSNMLEQAIIDAQSLREAAMKNAESEIVEKYSDEVKQAVSKLLEQEEEMDLGLGLEDEEEQIDSTAMEQVPMAHVSDGAEDIVEVDLDDIIAAAQSEDDDEEFELSRDEIADEVGIDLDLEPEAPANRSDDELSLDEGELLDLFKELLVVDVPELAVKQSMEEASEDEIEEDEEAIVQDDNVALAPVEGMDKEDAEELRNEKEKNENLQKENKDLKSLLGSLKDKLEELHAQNARLLYTNRVHENTSLNERQKNKIVEMISSARSVDEAKVIFETLQKTMAGITKSKTPESLSEAVTKRSSVILSNRRDEHVSQQNPTTDRWAILAGLKDN